MSTQHLLCAVATCAVLTVFVSNQADSQKAGETKVVVEKSESAKGLAPLAIRNLAPIVPFGGGKSTKAYADAQAASALAGVVTKANTQPKAQPSQAAPAALPPAAGPGSPPPTTTPASQPSGGAPKLRPDQKRAVELSIVGTEPSMRPFMYEQMAKNLAPYDEKQIAALIKGLEANASKEDLAAVDAAMKTDGPVTGALSKADFDFNRAQYEPAIRQHWAAKKKFDDFVNAKRAAYCPNRDSVARFGAAWRYELVQFGMESAVASQNPDADVAVLGSSYAPQDGRYKFDFSKVRMTFDEKAVDAAVKEGCDGYKAEGVKFLAKIDPMIARQDWEGAHRAEQAAMGGVDIVLDRMNAKLAKLSPDDGYPMLTALQNGKRIKS